LVVRNGHLPERELQTGLGPVTVKVPKVRSKSGEPVSFQSALVPPYVRKTKSLEAAIPWLYLKGISSGEMGEALKVLVGPDAKGLSASTVSRLKQQWAEEYRNWCNGTLDKERWVYIWVDGIYSGLRGEQVKLCALVVIGVNAFGDKHFLASYCPKWCLASESSGDQIDLCDFNTVFELYSSYYLGQIVEAS
jgi:transposase-like protein